jgi:hypothetical protein
VYRVSGDCSSGLCKIHVIKKSMPIRSVSLWCCVGCVGQPWDSGSLCFLVGEDGGTSSPVLGDNYVYVHKDGRWCHLFVFYCGFL